ncbi:hypothetical protein FRX31_015914 [Thalictrum thalictroides]|uniref:Uncharacterized protein n=1 Tax=Thalictrum thalictroides TaxID=46969 RepID=A0A7J6WCB7_THATH|nr:hypothetical protein FRX31_015914 [Thalictrum thalictroides]
MILAKVFCSYSFVNLGGGKEILLISEFKRYHLLLAAFPYNRLGMGAFRIALESIFSRYVVAGIEPLTDGIYFIAQPCKTSRAL